MSGVANFALGPGFPFLKDPSGLDQEAGVKGRENAMDLILPLILGQSGELRFPALDKSG